jgi:O-antigen ligase
MSPTGVLFLLGFLVVLALSLTRHPLYGLYAYLGVFYVHPPSRWWGEALPDMRWSLLAAAVTLGSIWLRSPPDSRPSWFSTGSAKIMMVFVAWFWIGSLWALDTDQHIPEAVKLTKYLLVCYMVYKLVDTPSKCMYFLLAHLMGCLYLGYLGRAMHTAGRLDGVGGPGIDDSNTLGMHLATAVVAALVISLHVRRQLLLPIAIAAAASLNAIILTGSRGAILALVCGAAAIVPLRPTQYAKKLYILIAIGLVGFGAIASEQLWERMSTLKAFTGESEQEVDLSAESRLVMAQAQLEMFKRFPFGAGHRGSEYLSPEYLDPIYLTDLGGRSSHNVFLTVLVEQGVPGVILSLLLIGWVVKATLEVRLASRRNNDLTAEVCNAAVFGSLVVVWIGGLFADFSHYEAQMWMFALLASLRIYSSGQNGSARAEFAAANRTH